MPDSVPEDSMSTPDSEGLITYFEAEFAIPSTDGRLLMKIFQTTDDLELFAKAKYGRVPSSDIDSFAFRDEELLNVGVTEETSLATITALITLDHWQYFQDRAPSETSKAVGSAVELVWHTRDIALGYSR